MSARIAYLVSRFPKISETFVLYELLEIERQGLPVHLFSLLRQREEVSHPEAEALLPRVHFAPFVSARIAWDCLVMAAKRPRALAGVIREIVVHGRGNRNFLFGGLAILPKTLHFARRMQARGVTHVHAHFANHPTTAALIIHRMTGLPFSFTAHGSDLHVDQTLLDRKIAAAAVVVTISRFNVEFMAERVGAWVRPKVRVVHCGIDLSLFQGRPAELPGPKGALRIICVASFELVKGHKHLLNALHALRNRGIDVTCDLVGDGPLRADLEAASTALGLDGLVRFHGAQPQHRVRDLLGAADVAILPSVPTPRGDLEGIPVALMEAMACELPVISTRQSGMPELIADGESGFLCGAGDEACLADALARLAADPDLRRRLGQAGRATVEQRFNLPRNAAALAELLVTTTAASTPGT